AGNPGPGSHGAGVLHHERRKRRTSTGDRGSWIEARRRSLLPPAPESAVRRLHPRVRRNLERARRRAGRGGADAVRSAANRARLWAGRGTRVRVLRRLARAVLVRPLVRAGVAATVVRRGGDDARADLARVAVTRVPKARRL